MSIVWVTGAHGFLGRHVAKRFATAGWTVAGVGPAAAHSVSLTDVPISKIGGRPAWIGAPVDIGSLDHLLALTGPPAAVLHAAGPGTVGPSVADPLRDFRSGVETTAVILDFLRRHAPAARFVFPSSAAVYGNQLPEPIGEDADAAPISPYGVHKLAAEWLCRSAAHSFGQPCSIVRFFSLYGPGLKKQLLWDVALRLLASPDTISLMGTGKETRDFLHVEDAADLAFLAATKPSEPFVLLNGGSGQKVTVRELVEALARAFGLATRVLFTGEVRSFDPQYLHADVTRARAFGQVQRWSFAAGLESYAAWVRSAAGQAR